MRKPGKLRGPRAIVTAKVRPGNVYFSPILRLKILGSCACVCVNNAKDECFEDISSRFQSSSIGKESWRENRIVVQIERVASSDNAKV